MNPGLFHRAKADTRHWLKWWMDASYGSKGLTPLHALADSTQAWSAYICYCLQELHSHEGGGQNDSVIFEFSMLKIHNISRCFCLTVQSFVICLRLSVVLTDYRPHTNTHTLQLLTGRKEHNVSISHISQIKQPR